MIDITTVQHIAKLARLTLTEEEMTQYAKELSAIFGYIDQLAEVDTEGVEETAQVTGLMNVVREDIPEDCGEEMKKTLIDAFPEKVGNLLRVHAVFDNQDE